MTDKAKWNAVHEEFYGQAAATGLRHTHLHVLVADNMADEIKRLRAENAALLHRADRAERILDKLRHPREAVLHATNAKFPFEASMIMAAVKAAEQEVDNDKHR